MKHSGQGIHNAKAEDQPADKQRAQTAHHSGPDRSVSREATGDRRKGEAQEPRRSGASTGERGRDAKSREAG